jgi:GT2 family glycosyltransferase
MLSVVIIAYKRPELLTQILEQLDERVSPVYVLVDSDPNNSEENLKCKEIALEASTNNTNVYSNFPTTNLGPGRAVPFAITWALENEDTILVLEDDCIPSDKSIEYFENILEICPTAGIICGSSPFDFMGKASEMDCVTTSKYALISGWVVKKSTWVLLEIENREKYSYKDVLKSGMKNPRNLVPLSYFYASMIRVRAGLAQAWDSFLCFSMLINHVNSVVPNVTLISNLGLDSVASNTKSTHVSRTNIYQAASNQPVANRLDTSKRMERRTNREIEGAIYKLKMRHLLSPIKSVLLSR